MVDGLKVRERSGGAAVCVYCRAAIAGDGVACGGCGVELHAACRTELGRCPTLGCRQAGRAAAGRPARLEEQPGRAPGASTWVVAAVLLLLGVAGLVRERSRAERARRAAEAAARATAQEARRAEAARLERVARLAAEQRREEAARQAAWDAARDAADLATPVGMALGPLEVPQRADAGMPGQALLARACEEDGLHLEPVELRRVFTSALLRSVALRDEGWAGVQRLDHRRLALTLARHHSTGAVRRARLRATLSVTHADARRLELRVSVHGPRSRPGEALGWTETWTAAALTATRARLRGAVIDRREAGADRTVEAFADETRTIATWGAGPLPTLVRVTRHEGAVRHEVEVELVTDR